MVVMVITLMHVMSLIGLQRLQEKVWCGHLQGVPHLQTPITELFNYNMLLFFLNRIHLKRKHVKSLAAILM